MPSRSLDSVALDSVAKPLLLGAGESSPLPIDPLHGDACAGTLQALATALRTELERRCPWAGIVDVPGRGSVQIGLVLSKRAENVLRRHGIATIKQLLTMSRSDLMDLPGAGLRVVNEIEAELRQLGLQLRSEPASYGR